MSSLLRVAFLLAASLMSLGVVAPEARAAGLFEALFKQPTSARQPFELASAAPVRAAPTKAQLARQLRRQREARRRKALQARLIAEEKLKRQLASLSTQIVIQAGGLTLSDGPQIQIATPAAATPVVETIDPAAVVKSYLADDSLRRGDAVMTQDGLRIYVGSSGRRKTASDFVTLEQAQRIDASVRSKLASLEPPRAAPLHAQASPRKAPAPREIAAARPAAADPMIRDPRGREIRHVGGYYRVTEAARDLHTTSDPALANRLSAARDAPT